MRAVVAVVLFLSLATCGSAACTQAISIVTKDGWDAKDASIYTEPAFETLQVGDTYTSYTTFTVGDKTITGGNDNEKATLSGITVQNKNEPLCDALSGTDIPCPLIAGTTYTSATTVTIDPVPSGTLVGTITWTNQDGDGIIQIVSTFCI